MTIQNTKLTVAISYPGIYKQDPKTVLKLINLFKLSGYEVYLVTSLDLSDTGGIPKELRDVVNAFYITSGEAKIEYMAARGIPIDLWIDDNPATVYMAESAASLIPKPVLRKGFKYTSACSKCERILHTTECVTATLAEIETIKNFEPETTRREYVNGVNKLGEPLVIQYNTDSRCSTC